MAIDFTSHYHQENRDTDGAQVCVHLSPIQMTHSRTKKQNIVKENESEIFKLNSTIELIQRSVRHFGIPLLVWNGNTQWTM